MEVEEPILEYGQLDLNGTYTYSDYLKWQFPERVELIRGKIRKMSPTPNTKHQTILGNLFIGFRVGFSKQNCKVFLSPFDVRLPIPNAKKDTTVVQPDLCIICDHTKLDVRGCNGAPDLVVEVLSPGNTSHEMNTKFKLYEESGVKEYWIIEPHNKTIFIYTQVDSTYVGLRPFTEGMQVQSPLFPDLAIKVDAIFEDV